MRLRRLGLFSGLPVRFRIDDLLEIQPSSLLSDFLSNTFAFISLNVFLPDSLVGGFAQFSDIGLNSFAGQGSHTFLTCRGFPFSRGAFVSSLLDSRINWRTEDRTMKGGHKQ